MRLFFNNKFQFMGFSYGVPGISIILVLLGAILLITLFLPLYPIWYFLVMKYWDKLVVVNPDDQFYHISGVKPRVADMTRFQWKMLLWVWFIVVITLIFCI